MHGIGGVHLLAMFARQGSPQSRKNATIPRENLYLHTWSTRQRTFKPLSHHPISFWLSYCLVQDPAALDRTMSITSSTLSLGVNLPIGWNYHGCWTDYGRRKLAGPSYTDIANMTQQNCISFCNDKNHPYAGLEYGQECYCGLTIGTSSESKDNTECAIKCSGADEEACGAGNRLTVFYTDLLNYTRTNPGPLNTSRIGCIIDDVYARTLPIAQTSEDSMTVDKCTTSCKAAGYNIAGLEFGRECFCGNDLENNATITDEGCDMRCAGDSSEFCGGYGRLDT